MNMGRCGFVSASIVKMIKISIDITAILGYN